MALSVGDLVAYLRLDDSEFDRGLDRGESMFAGWGKKIGALAAGAGVAVGAAFVERFTTAMNVDAANDKLAGQLDLTVKESERAGKIAGQVFRGAYGDSMDDVNTAIRGVVSNLGDLADTSDAEVQRMTEHALNLAETFEWDVAKSTQVVGQMLKQGLAKDADEAFDVLVSGAQKAGQQSDELLEAFSEYGEPLASLGLNAEQAMSMLVEGAAGGEMGIDKLGDAMKEFSVRAVETDTPAVVEAYDRIGLKAGEMAEAIASGGPKASEAMATIIEKLGEVEDPVARNTAGVSLFGSMWEDIGEKAILGLDPTISKMGEVEGAANRLDETVNDNLKTRLTETWRTITDKARELLGKVVVWLDEKLKPAFQNIRDWWDVNGPAIIGWFEDVGESIRVWVEEVAKPNFDAFVAALEEHWPTIEDIFNKLGSIVEDVGEMIAKTMPGASEDVGEMEESWSSDVGAMLETIDGLLTGVERVTSAIADAWDVLTFAWIGNVDSMIESSQEWRRKGSQAIRNMVSAVVDKGAAIIGWFRALPGKIMSALVTLPGEMYWAGVDIVEGIWSGISSMGGWLWDNVSSFMTRNIPGPVKRALGISSPSRVMAEMAREIPRGMMVGMDAEAGRLMASAERMASRALPDLGVPSMRMPTVSGAGVSGGGDDRGSLAMVEHHLKQLRRAQERQAREPLVTAINRADRLTG